MIDGMELTSAQKAAAILVAIGKPAAGRLLKFFKQDELKTLIEGARKLKTIPQSELEKIVAEFEEEVGQMLDERAQFNLRPDAFPYGYSKQQAEQVAEEFVQRGLDVVIVNPAVVLGPRDVNLISGSIIVEAAKHSLPAMPPGGVSFIDVADVCAGQIAAAEMGRTGERYILTGENLWYRDVFTQLAQMLGRRPPALALPGGAFRFAANIVDFARESLKMKLPLNGDQVRFSADTFWFDAGKARRELGLNPMPFIDSARRTYEWYKASGFI